MMTSLSRLLRTDRHLVLMVISVIVLVTSISFYVIINEQVQLEQREAVLSKLDAIQEEAKHNQNVTIIKPDNMTVLLPTTNATGRISGLGSGPIIIQ